MKSTGGAALSSHEFLDLETSLEDVVAELVRDVESKGKTSKAAAKKSRNYGANQMQKTFLAIARTHLSPLTRYVKAIQQGVVSKDLVEVMNLIVTQLVNKTRQVGLDQHARKLKSFQVVLQQIEHSEGNKITVVQSASLYEVYWPLFETFKLE